MRASAEVLEEMKGIAATLNANNGFGVADTEKLLRLQADYRMAKRFEERGQVILDLVGKTILAVEYSYGETILYFTDGSTVVFQEER